MANRNQWLGASGCLLVLLGVYAFFHFRLLCLAVPCDREVQVKVRVVGSADPAAAKCVVQLFSMDGPISRNSSRDSEIEEGAASFITGPWSTQYRARVSCKGFKPSSLVVLDVPDDKETVDLGTVRLDPETGN